MNLRDIDGKDTGQNTRSENSDHGPGSWHATRQGGTLVFASGDFFDSMGGPLEHSTIEERDFDIDIEGDARSGSAEDVDRGQNERA